MDRTTRGKALLRYMSQVELGRLLDIDSSSVNHKIAGRRPWKLSEMEVVLDHLRREFDSSLTLDDLFGSEAA